MQEADVFVTSPFLPPFDELAPLLRDVWSNKFLTNNGPYHEEFESILCDYLGVPYVSLFNNCTTALLAAVKTLNLTGEVITTPYSFVATSHALLWNGIRPVFVDIEESTLGIDPICAEAAITNKTSGILPVHCYGIPCNVDLLDEISNAYRLPIVYDAAHAFGVSCHCGSLLMHGELSVLSFHATKVFNTFEGGAIVCKDLKTKESIDRFKNFGFTDEVSVKSVGINGKMNEFSAALGIIQIRHIQKVIAMREAVDFRYREQLKNLPGVTLVNTRLPVNPNFAYFPILIDEDYPLTRDELYLKLKTNRIYARRYFFPLISQHPMYRDLPSSTRDNLPVATRIAESILCLPIHPELSESDQSRVIEIIIEPLLR